jgi:hypothetical protein
MTRAQTSAMAEEVGAVQEVVDMTADPHQAHTTTRVTTAGTTRDKTPEWVLDRLPQQTMAMARHHRVIMADRSFRKAQGPRQLQPRQEMETIARPCGGCLAL